MSLYFETGEYNGRNISAFPHLSGSDFQKAFVGSQHDLLPGVDYRKGFREVKLLLIGGTERIVLKGISSLSSRVEIILLMPPVKLTTYVAFCLSV